jgi:hypothetical protein
VNVMSMMFRVEGWIILGHNVPILNDQKRHVTPYDFGEMFQCHRIDPLIFRW